MPSPILARADALMQRRRQGGGELDEIPVLTDTVDNDDDIPVLLDAEIPAPVVEPEAEPEPAGEVAEEALPPPAFDTAARDALAHELARRVEQRLAAELPRLIESTLRDFLAEQEMIDTLQPPN
ncbi:hypothetical protein AT959_03890 [Dechloromonas denitrificans]|uniref:DNA polymerase III subunit chi n=1 Tax=Dechloromonas denitrificans TaxID=281362 RepID=A0A133XMM9_9RHOO|nr:hypothetical protein [Dechloromonas denitrificans]KXB32207.1 hypothetical protein AT959_03890 [Dechloromonas denitrificans]